jgi:hypothetical protein
MGRTAGKQKMTKRVLICGRGGSLDFIDHTLLEQEFEYVILTNEFNSFVKQDNKMSNFLKNKKIIQFLNITESGLDQNFLDNFNIEKIYVTPSEVKIRKKLRG